MLSSKIFAYCLYALAFAGLICFLYYATFGTTDAHLYRFVAGIAVTIIAGAMGYIVETAAILDETKRKK